MSKGQALDHEEQQKASQKQGGTAQEQRRTKVDQNLAGMRTRHVANAAGATALAIPEAHAVAFKVDQVLLSSSPCFCTASVLLHAQVILFQIMIAAG